MRKFFFSIILLSVALSVRAQLTVALGDTTYQHTTDSLMQIADYEFFYGGNFDKAYDFYVKAYKLGSTDAAYMLGRCYSEGVVDTDWDKAVKLWHQAALSGNADAAYQIASCLMFGNGFEKDMAKAADWYRKASDLGSLEGAFVLGNMYMLGTGVEQDMALAEEYWTKAADKGYTAWAGILSRTETKA